MLLLFWEGEGGSVWGTACCLPLPFMLSLVSVRGDVRPWPHCPGLASFSERCSSRVLSVSAVGRSRVQTAAALVLAHTHVHTLTVHAHTAGVVGFWRRTPARCFAVIVIVQILLLDRLGESSGPLNSRARLWQSCCVRLFSAVSQSLEDLRTFLQLVTLAAPLE